MLNRETIQQMKAQLKTGMRIISAPQLFPSPIELAERMVYLAHPGDDHKILEPSAGTGRLLDAIFSNGIETEQVEAVEIEYHLIQPLRDKHPGLTVHHDNFLTMAPEPRFDRILMNPPFKNGADILHIKHAYSFLAPGGRLIAICAGGPRQKQAFEECATFWEDLPDGTFKDEGTNVRTALLILEKS